MKPGDASQSTMAPPELDLFGYQFTDPHLATAPGQPLLNDDEQRELDGFFDNPTNWQTADPSFPPTDGHVRAREYYNVMQSPPYVHQVTTTTLEQTQAPQRFGYGPVAHTPYVPQYPDPSHSATHNNAHAAQLALAHDGAGSPFSPTSGRKASFSQQPFPSARLVQTSHGLLHEQLAAMLPLHSQRGSVDAQVAAELAQEPAVTALAGALAQRSRAQLPRVFAYGTDRSFNDTGYTPPVPNAEDTVSEQLVHRSHAAFLLDESRPGTLKRPREPEGEDWGTADAEGVEDVLSNGEEEENQTIKKKGKARAPAKPSNGRQKSISKPRPTKVAKRSTSELPTRDRRSSTPSVRPARENLTAEQKRENHNISEQRRRNLVNRHFDDLKAIMPELRVSGLKRAAMLAETTKFVEKLIRQDKEIQELLGEDDET